MTFKRGDLVRLKHGRFIENPEGAYYREVSNSPVMMVHKQHDSPLGGATECIWFNTKQEKQEDAFGTDQLEKV